MTRSDCLLKLTAQLLPVGSDFFEEAATPAVVLKARRAVRHLASDTF